ncbi:MAG: pitrilysin family protein [Patescibacteria group bacterium]
MNTTRFQHLQIPAAITTFDNGLAIASCEVQSAFVEVNLAVALGSMDDGDRLGIAHFIEHILFVGPTCDTVHPLLRPLARRATDVNAWTDRYLTCYETSSGENVAEQLEALLGMTREIITTPEAMEVERRIILQEIEEGKYEPGFYNWRMRMLYPNAPGLHHSTDGTSESVKALTLSNLWHHHHRWYGPSNMLVQVASRLPHDEVLDLVASSLLLQAPRSDCLRPRPALIPRCIQAVQHDANESDELSMYTPLPATISAKEKVLLSIVGDLLSHSDFGLLYRRLRPELGVVYHVSASLIDLPGTPFLCDAKTHRKNMRQVEDEYRAALRRIVSCTYSMELFEAVLNDHRKRLLLQKEYAPLNGCLSDLEQAWLTGKDEDIDETQIINGASYDSLAEVAAKYLLEKPISRLRVLEGEGEK